MFGSVQAGGDSFPITNGVKQCCVLAPTLFGIFFAVMLDQAFDELRATMSSSDFRKDGRLFNAKDFDAKTRTLAQLIIELLYADDCALLA